MVDKGGHDDDPRGLIFESYRIAGITPGECRSIFLDWAMNVPQSRDTSAAIAALLARYAAAHPNHPMTQVLRDGQAAPARPRRRGGAMGRNRG
ncbi:hypothetical protein LGT41_0012075 [Abyssibius alkaniclasticus]|uniref:hypothetical protein n=1 Tax=Abyssibius alkaniclasticus TaxID=2881234 RepID=UPI002363E3C8|nr:hypothetical protein [Abyssibius alkaniclasticus]UPH70522.1 hypothetical protein LGT41_0012075 [Abyssibius alkaniclasticus]